MYSSNGDSCTAEKIDDKIENTCSAAAEDGCISNTNLHSLVQQHKISSCNFHH